MSEAVYKRAPRGFTSQEREAFDRDGYLIIENALSKEEVGLLLEIFDTVAERHPNYQPGKNNDFLFGVAQLHPLLARLIDDERHVGYAYDLYGELLKLHNSQFFRRRPGKSEIRWHHDGARSVPHAVYSPIAPYAI